MRRTLHHGVWLALLCAAAPLAFAQHHSSFRQRWHEAAEKARLTSPGIFHQRLMTRAGDYATTTYFWSNPRFSPSTTIGEAHLHPSMDGRFLIEEDAQPGYQGMRVWGFSNFTQQFESTWFDNRSTAMQTFTGTTPDGGWTVQYVGSYRQPDGVEQLQVIVRQLDPDHFQVEMFSKLPNGTEGPHQQTVYSRQVAPPPFPPPPQPER